jgi:hypothetical protein
MQQREGRRSTAGDDVTGGAVLIDIDAELSCWQQLEGSATSELVFLFHEWEPAIRVGIHAYLAYPERDFDSIEPDIVAAYQRIRGGSRIPWASAAPAARRVWEKLQGQDDEGPRRAWSARAWQQARASTELPVEV